MASFGYGDLELEEILDRIADGYQEHMDGKRGFPHEIGIVPGYRRWMWRDSSRRKAEIFCIPDIGKYMEIWKIR